MSNILHRFTLLVDSINIIQQRMLFISSPEDFIKDENGLTLYDSITVRLQIIGENLGKVFKNHKEILDKLEIEALPIINFRNIVSHEYELLDYQVVYKICVFDLPILKQKIQTFLSSNNEPV